MALLLGLDIGTTGCKAIVIDEKGNIVGMATRHYQADTPRPGWTEQDPAVWKEAVEGCMGDLSSYKLDAIGVTGQMHGSVFLEGEGNPVHPALLWNDQRTIRQCAFIESALQRETLMEITGNPALTGFQLGKVLWLREQNSEAFKRVRKILLPKDYIVYCLTGAYSTDVSDASGVGALDLKTRDWSPKIFQALDLDSELFPAVNESSTLIGKTERGVAVVAGAGDQAAGAVGTGTIQAGTLSISLGTSGVVFGCIESPRYLADGSAHTFCHANGGYHAMGVTLNCGGAVAWMRDMFLPSGDFAQFDELAAQSSVGANGVVFLPYLSGERSPHNDPSARANIANLSSASRRSDILRAGIEGASYALLDAFDSLQELGVNPDCIRATGGGAKSRLWLQVLADVFKRPVERAKSDEGPAFGAAILGGVGIGAWPDLASATDATVRFEAPIQPSGADYEQSLANYRSLYRATRDWQHSLAHE